MGAARPRGSSASSPRTRPARTDRAPQALGGRGGGERVKRLGLQCWERQSSANGPLQAALCGSAAATLSPPCAPYRRAPGRGAEADLATLDLTHTKNGERHCLQPTAVRRLEGGKKRSKCTHRIECPPCIERLMVGRAGSWSAVRFGSGCGWRPGGIKETRSHTRSRRPATRARSAAPIGVRGGVIAVSSFLSVLAAAALRG